MDEERKNFTTALALVEKAAESEEKFEKARKMAGEMADNFVEKYYEHGVETMVLALYLTMTSMAQVIREFGKEKGAIR